MNTVMLTAQSHGCSGCSSFTIQHLQLELLKPEFHYADVRDKQVRDKRVTSPPTSLKLRLNLNISYVHVLLFRNKRG